MRGSIRKRFAKDGSKRYDVRYRAGSQQHTKTFLTEKAAERFTATTMSNVADGTYREVQSATMVNVFANWEKTLAADLVLGSLKRSTYRSYRSVLTRHLVPAFGGYRSSELTDKVIADWRTEQAAKIATGTIAAKTFNNMIGVLKVVLDWATTGAGAHALGRNPMPQKRLRAKIASEARPIIQGAEIAQLWAATDGQNQIVVALALFAGLRRGEIFGLQWDDIVWPRGQHAAEIHVARAFVQRQVVSPKSAAGIRTVQLPPRLVDLLAYHDEDRPPIALEDGTSYLIRQDDGKPVDPDNWAKRVWPTIQRAAKLPSTVTLHALRHTYGSLLLADGAPVKHVSEQMGHANPLITMQTYQKVLRRSSTLATSQLNRYIPARQTLRLVKSKRRSE